MLSLDRNAGLLIVNTSQDGAKVFLNNRLYRRPSENGMLRIPLEAGNYSVRVEKDGFTSPETRTLALKKGEEKLVTFALEPAPAYLEISGTVAGAQVKLDGQESGRDGPERRIPVTDGRRGSPHGGTQQGRVRTVRVSEQFSAGKTGQLGREQVGMVKAAKSAPPDARKVEAQEWSQIATSSNPDDFDSFIRNHPGGAHLEQARNRAGELRNSPRRMRRINWNRLPGARWTRIIGNSCKIICRDFRPAFMARRLVRGLPSWIGQRPRVCLRNACGTEGLGTGQKHSRRAGGCESPAGV